MTYKKPLKKILCRLLGGAATVSEPVIGAFCIRLTRTSRNQKGFSFPSESLHKKQRVHGLGLIEQLLSDTIITVGQTLVNIGEQGSLIIGLIFIVAVQIFPQGIVCTFYNKGLNTR